MLRPMIGRLVEGEHLSETETMEAVEHIMHGGVSDGQVGAFLAALRLKGETVDEVVGAARVMRRHAIGLTHRLPDLLDTCGTGGDATGSFNISTATALVLAGCGVKVAKHGNRAVSSASGSADALQALGVAIDVDVETVTTCIEQAGVGFLYAPLVHTAMRHVAPVRRDLSIRTIFNLLGPLTNPARVDRQIVGVCRPEMTSLLAQALVRLGTSRALVVHGSDGLDEVSLSGPTLVAEVKDGTVAEYLMAPEDAGLHRSPLHALRGGDARTNANIIAEVLDGASGPARDVVLLNAAAALRLCDGAADLRDGVAVAAEAIDSGRAREALRRLSYLTTHGQMMEAQA